MKIIEISDAEMQSLTESILVRHGIDFTCYEPKSLKRRIKRVISNLNLSSVHDLWVRFLRDQDFVHAFMNQVSVGMTSMFRDPVLWHNFKQRLQSEYLFKKTVDVWHAGCSTGEEVFSFGILLSELRMSHKVKAIATDFSQESLATAQSGVYHKIKMIDNEKNYREYNAQGDFESYYQRDVNECIMDDSLIKHVDFFYHNLITNEVPAPGSFDIIFCRNVLIYFDNRAKERVIESFYQSLKPGGYFIVGFFDTIGHLLDRSKFELVDQEAKIFRKI